MSAVVWTSARAAVRVHRGSLVGSAVVVALASALLTMTGVWIEAGVRHAGDPAGSTLLGLGTSFAGTAIMIALLVVASTFSAALRPRAREFAMLRAVGATVAQVRKFVAAEVLLVFAAAVPLGVVPGLLLAGNMTGMLEADGIVPPGFTTTLSPWPVLVTLALLVPTALGTAWLSGRESAKLDPAGAVRSSAAEPKKLPRARVWTAGVLTVGGLAVAAIPLVMPGTMGAVSASLAAFLLVTAAALAGPLILGAVARRVLRVTRGAGAVSTLAMLNARGFSRRMTGVIVPLALLVAVGAVQSGVNITAADAAEKQMREGITADLVVPVGTPETAAAVAGLPGVASAEVAGAVPVSVRTDQDGGAGALAWETSSLMVLPEDDGLLDPGVSSGSLDALADGQSIAVSREVFGVGVGDPVDVRVGQTETRFTVGAVYDRGLGLGSYLVSAAGAARAGAGQDGMGMLLVRADDGADVAAVRAAIAAAGLPVTTVGGYADQIRSGAGEDQTLSLTMLFALLTLVVVMAANTLVVTTRSRGQELALLRRTGATRRQVFAMVGTESALVTVTALVVGMACALPALAGSALGLLGVPVPAFDPLLLAGMAGAVALIGLAVPLAAVAGVTRHR